MRAATAKRFAVRRVDWDRILRLLRSSPQLDSWSHKHCWHIAGKDERPRVAHGAPAGSLLTTGHGAC